MSQKLLITLKKNIKKVDEVYDCIYTEKSDVGDLLTKWMCFSPINNVHISPLTIIVRDWCFFDKFQEDFLKIKNHCPLIKSFDDIWKIQDWKTLGFIHISQRQDRIMKNAFGNTKDSPDLPKGWGGILGGLGQDLDE